MALTLLDDGRNHGNTNMNETTIALLDGLGIDRTALDALRAFHKDRNPATYKQGKWGEAVGLPGEFAIYLADFESPDCPEGWDTFRGFLANTEPETVGFMEKLADSDKREEATLFSVCRLKGITPLRVSAPAWLAREGVFETVAFPLHVLRAYVAGQAA